MHPAQSHPNLRSPKGDVISRANTTRRPRLTTSPVKHGRTPTGTPIAKSKPKPITPHPRDLEIPASIEVIAARYEKTITNPIPLPIVLERVARSDSGDAIAATATSDSMNQDSTTESKTNNFHTNATNAILPQYQDMAHLIVLSPSHLLQIFQKEHSYCIPGVQVPRGFRVRKPDWEGFKERMRFVDRVYRYTSDFPADEGVAAEREKEEMMACIKMLNEKWDEEVAGRMRRIEEDRKKGPFGGSTSATSTTTKKVFQPLLFRKLNRKGE